MELGYQDQASATLARVVVAEIANFGIQFYITTSRNVNFGSDKKIKLGLN